MRGTADVLESSARRYAAVVRGITWPIAALVAIQSADTDPIHGRTLWAVAIFSAWSVAWVIAVLRAAGAWVTIVDAGLLVVLGLGTPWLASESWLAAGRSWLVPFATFAVVAYQYYEQVLASGLAAVAVGVAMTVGTLSGRPDGAVLDGVVTAVWLVGVAILARALWTMVVGGGRQADLWITTAETEQHAQQLAEKVRAQEDAISRAIHDTAAATLLMVGMGAGAPTLVQARARRDLDEMTTWHLPGSSTQADLVSLVQHAIRYSGMSVLYKGPPQLTLPAVTAHGLAEATAEALANVSRHAGVAAAEIDITQEGTATRVTIRDRGRGFDAAAVPATRRGLQRSVVERLEAIGGVAHLYSAPGQGTRVDLVWPDA